MTHRPRPETGALVEAALVRGTKSEPTPRDRGRCDTGTTRSVRTRARARPRPARGRASQPCRSCTRRGHASSDQGEPKEELKRRPPQELRRVPHAAGTNRGAHPPRPRSRGGLPEQWWPRSESVPLWLAHGPSRRTLPGPWEHRGCADGIEHLGRARRTATISLAELLA